LFFKNTLNLSLYARKVTFGRFGYLSTGSRNR